MKNMNANSITYYDMDTVTSLDNYGNSDPYTLKADLSTACSNQGTTTLTTNAGIPLNTAASTASSTISVNPIYYNNNTWTTGYSYSVWDGCEEGESGKTIEEYVEERVEKYLESEDDMIPLVKNYLRKYLEKVMDNPDEIVKEIIKEKDEEIDSLRKEVDMLRKDIADLHDQIRRKIDREKTEINWPNVGDQATTTGSTPYITWIGGSDTYTNGNGIYGISGLDDGFTTGGSSAISHV